MGIAVSQHECDLFPFFYLNQMVDDGYEDVCGADISRVVIAQMKVRCEDLPAVSFFQGTL